MVSNRINRYCLAFPFQGRYEFIYVRANEIANEIIGQGDDIIDFKYDEGLGQSEEHIFHRDDKEYYADFSFDGPTMIDVFDVADMDENLVEKGIPYLCVAIDELQDNGEWKRIFSIANSV